MPKRAMLKVRSWIQSDFVRHGAWVLASAVALNASNYVYHFFMTRWLGPEHYGALSSLLAVISLTSIPAAIVTMIVVKYAAEFHSLDDTPKLRSLYRRVLGFSSALCAVAFLIIVLCRSAIAGYLHIDQPFAVELAALTVACAFVMPGVRAIVQGTQDFRKLAFSIGIEGVGKCAAGIALTFFGMGLIGALLGAAAGSLLSLIYTLVALRNYGSGERSRLRLDFARLYKTSGAIALMIVSLQVVSFIDVVIVKHFFSAERAGLYSAVALSGKIMLFAVSFLPSLVLPKAAALATRGENTNSLLRQAAFVTAAICGMVLAVMLIAPGVVLRVIAGAAYVTAAPYLFRYAVAMTFLAASTVAANYQIALHRFGFVLPCAALCAVEIAALMVWHASVDQILNVLMVLNAAIFIACVAQIQHRVSVPAVSLEPSPQ